MVKLKLKDGVDGLRLRETPVNGKAIDQIFKGELLEALEDDESLLNKIGVEGEWVKLKTPDGFTGYTAGWLLVFDGEPPVRKGSASVDKIIAEKAASAEEKAPAATSAKISVSDSTDAPKFAVRPTIKALRLRLAPVDGEPIGVANMESILICEEDEETINRKVGIEGEWLKVRTLWGQSAYAAAWFVQKHIGEIPEAGKIPVALNTTGVNLDVQHPLGTPDPALLKGMGWVRLGYNVSAAKGSEDIQAAYDRYAPHIERYARAGIKVMLVFTHQTYGEGKNEFWPWPQMTTTKWRKLSGRLSEMVAKIVEQYRGKDLVHAYQVWNEQDAHIGEVASEPMHPSDYAIILGDLIRTIKRVDPTAYVITGGHTGGPGKGSDYARAAINALPAGVLPDGIALHPYGRGITQPAPPYTIFGHIDDSMNAYLPILAGKPVWITEWGVLDRPNDAPGAILNYASGFVKHLKDKYPGAVASMIWYAWAMTMHNGYGLVNAQSQPLQPLNDGFRQL